MQNRPAPSSWAQRNSPFPPFRRRPSALPCDTVLIGGGIYREWVSPANGGLSDDNRITYAALPGQTPVVSGAEELTG